MAFPAAFDDSVGLLLIDADPSASVPGQGAVLLDDRRPACMQQHRCEAAWCDDTNVEVHFTACPYATSTRRLDPRFRDWFVFGNGDVDYLLGPAHEVRRTETVAARRLDSLARELAPGMARPGILSIDAQGASAEIVAGAESLLSDSVDAVVCEAETIPFYGGSPSLALLLPHLADRHFFLSGILPTGDPWASPCRNPIGLRGSPLLGSVDAIFVRDPRSLPAGAPGERVARYAFVACMMGHPDLAAAALLRAESPAGTSSIERFAREFRDAAALAPARYPPAFGSGLRHGRADAAVVRGDASALERCLAEHGFRAAATDVQARRLHQSAHASS